MFENGCHSAPIGSPHCAGHSLPPTPPPFPVQSWDNRDVTSTSASSRDIVLLGSTGSVGTQALDVIRANPERFRVVGLAAGGYNPQLLAAQVIEFGVPVVGVARGTLVQDVQLALYAQQRRGYHHGDPSFRGSSRAGGGGAGGRRRADIVLNAIAGAVGLRPPWRRWQPGPPWRWRTRSR